MNLCKHKENFGLDAIWSFFATSHGKSPCDGIGGTVKRKIARTSLQRPVSDQILTFKAVEQFCNESLKGITFLTILKQDMVQVREELEKRYALGDTVPGTRSFHHVQPISSNSLKAKQLSDDDVFLVNDHNFGAMPTAQEIASSIKPNDYATCFFDGYWWLVLIDRVNMEEKDVTCKFMHPHGPTQNNNFHWPSRDDEGYVPFNRFIMTVEIPTSSSNGRQYHLKEEELKKTNTIYENNK